MLRVISLFPLFSHFAERRRIALLPENTLGEFSEKRENRFAEPVGNHMLIPLISLFSQFAAVQKTAQYAACIFGVIADSQPTRCGHTLRGVLFRGWRGVLPPPRPLQSKSVFCPLAASGCTTHFGRVPKSTLPHAPIVFLASEPNPAFGTDERQKP